jgi:hypothetical protein
LLWLKFGRRAEAHFIKTQVSSRIKGLQRNEMGLGPAAKLQHFTQGNPDDPGFRGLSALYTLG